MKTDHLATLSELSKQALTSAEDRPFGNTFWTIKVGTDPRWRQTTWQHFLNYQSRHWSQMKTDHLATLSELSKQALTSAEDRPLGNTFWTIKVGTDPRWRQTTWQHFLNYQSRHWPQLKTDHLATRGCAWSLSGGLKSEEGTQLFFKCASCAYFIMIDNVLDLFFSCKKVVLWSWQQIILCFSFSFPTPSSLSLSLRMFMHMHVCVSKGVPEKSVLNTDIHGISEQEWIYIQCELKLFMWLCFQHHFHLAFSNVSAFSFKFCHFANSLVVSKERR